MKYILSHNNVAGLKDTKTSIQTFLENNHANILDGSMLPSMATVEVDAEHVAALKASLGKEWSLFPEKTYSLPTTKKSIGSK